MHDAGIHNCCDRNCGGVQIELLSEKDKADAFVAFPLSLDRALMEGRYNKVLELYCLFLITIATNDSTL